jgi:hypothetical protein
MLKLNEQVFDVPWHADATAMICIVPFDINARKFISGHVALDPVEFLEKVQEVVEVLIPTYSTPKSSTMRQNWMGHHLWRQRPGVDSAS